MYHLNIFVCPEMLEAKAVKTSNRKIMLTW